MLCPAKIKDSTGKDVSTCNKQYPEKFIKNRVSLFLRQLLEFYYRGKSLRLLNYCEKDRMCVRSPVVKQKQDSFYMMEDV
jgi:hypothetical protein